MKRSGDIVTVNIMIAESYAIMPSMHNAKKWSWSKFRRIDVSGDVLDIRLLRQAKYSFEDAYNNAHTGRGGRYMIERFERVPQNA